jgi:hypothetical protein
MKAFPDDVVLQIHHLDDGDEADTVVAVLSTAVESSGCRIERPSHETNSILVHCGPACDEDSDDPVRLENRLDKAASLLTALSKEDVDAIHAMDLEIMLCIQTDADRIWLPPELLHACASHGIGISVVDMTRLMGRISFAQDV